MWRSWGLGVVACCALGACARSGLDLGYDEHGRGSLNGTGGGARAGMGSDAVGATPGAGGAAASAGAGGGGSGGAGASGGAGGAPAAERSCASAEDPLRFAQGKVRYVDDAPECEGLAPCYSSITDAVANAANGDTVMLLPGTHAGAKITLEHRGGVAELRITSRDGPETTFVERPCLQVTDWEEKPGEIWIDHLSFRNCGPSTSLVSDGWGVYVYGSPEVGFRIFDNRLVGAGPSGGIAVAAGGIDSAMTGVVARNWLLDHSEPESFALLLDTEDAFGTCVRAENNVIAGNRYAASAGPRSEFVNNTLANNEFGPMGAAVNAVNANNLLFDTNPHLGSIEWGFEWVKRPRGEFHHNLVRSGELTGLNANFSADPLFIDAANHDYRLRAGSPAIGRGAHAEAPATDMAGRPRQDPPTLGAFEFDESAGGTEVGWGCGDGIVQAGLVTTPAGTYLGFETCDPGRGLADSSCNELCQFRAARPRRQISMAYDSLCAVRADRSLSCWGEAAEWAPTGRFSQVAVESDHACALGEDGTVTCWQDYGPYFSPPGSFSEITRAPCGLTAGKVLCWDGTGIQRTVEGDFVHLDEDCATAASGDRTCWKNGDTFPVGEYAQVFTWNLLGCGLAQDGSLTCVTANQVPALTSTLPTGFAQVDMRGDALVGLRPDGRALQFHGIQSEFMAPDRTFIELSVASFRNGCGLTAERDVYCWDEDPDLPHE